MKISPDRTALKNYTYTGREWDKETGLYYYRARYYDPMEGRFISKDPIAIIGGINLYSYVLNNPVNYLDPLGLTETNCCKKVKLWIWQEERGSNKKKEGQIFTIEK